MIENIKERFSGEDRAVSPVIGVILMVAITVILAAVIGTFVLGLTDEVNQTAPTASFTVDGVDADQDNVTVRHEGGDTIEADETTFIIENGSDSDRYAASENDEQPIDTTNEIVFNQTDGELVIEDTVINGNGDGTLIETDDKVTVTLIDEASGEIIWEREFRV